MRNNTSRRILQARPRRPAYLTHETHGEPTDEDDIWYRLSWCSPHSGQDVGLDGGFHGQISGSKNDAALHWSWMAFESFD